MNKPLTGAGREEEFIDHCIDNMQSDKEGQRIFGRLQRDFILLFEKEHDDCESVPELVSGTWQAMGALLVHFVMKSAKLGHEAQLLNYILTLLSKHTVECLDDSIKQRNGAPSAEKGAL